MDQSYLTRQAVVGSLQNRDVGYLEVQWYQQYPYSTQTYQMLEVQVCVIVIEVRKPNKQP